MQIDSIVLLLALFGAFMIGFLVGLLFNWLRSLATGARQAPGRLAQGLSRFGSRIKETLRPTPQERPGQLPEIPLPERPVSRAVAVALTFPIRRAKTLFGMAEEAYAAGQYRTAEGHYLTALFWDRGRSLPPLHIRANLRLGQIRAKRGDVTGAIVAYERVRDLDPANVKAYMQLGQLYFQAGQAGQAIYELGRALELDPGNLDVRYHLFQIYQQSGMQQEALRQLRLLKAGEDAEVIAALFLRHGREHLRQGDLALAATDYHLVLELTPEKQEATWTLGDIVQQQGQPEHALQIWARGLWRAPSPALDERLLALARQGLWEEVAVVYQRGLVLHPRTGRFYLVLGDMAHERGRLVEAAGYWERAAAVQPDLVEPHLRLEQHYQQMSQEKQAQEHLRAALRLLWGQEIVYRCCACEHVTPVEQPYCFVCGTWGSFVPIARANLEARPALVPVTLSQEARNLVHRLGNWWQQLRGLLTSPSEEET